jgi:hypothetical protein
MKSTQGSLNPFHESQNWKTESYTKEATPGLREAILSLQAYK